MKKEELKTVSADKFMTEDGWRKIYRFPFKVLDDTPGGGNLGRIHFEMEIFRGKKSGGRYYIEKILLWASQTNDQNYKETFEIPCFSERISGFSNTCRGAEKQDLLRFCSEVSFCNVHKNLVMGFYPENHHSVLVIELGSSIMIDMYFV